MSGKLIIYNNNHLCRVNLQKKEDSNISVLTRIMTNYFQMLAAAMAFNMDFPNYFGGVFSSANTVGQSSGVFLSVDCFLLETSMVETFDNVAYFKVMVLALIPLALILLCSIMFRLVCITDSMRYKRCLCVTVITVLFVLHPTLTQF